MNAARRKEIDKARAMIEEAKTVLEECAEGERDYYDNMPESLQSGDRGQQASAAADALEEATSQLEDVLGNLDTATE